MGIFFFCSALWYRNNYPDLAFEQILFHLQVPLKGANFQPVLIFLVTVLPISCVITGVLLYLLNHDVRRRKSKADQKERIDIVGPRFRERLKEISNRILPTIRRRGIFLSIVFMVVAILLVFQVLGIPALLYGRLQNSDQMGVSYVDPESVEIVFPEEKRNVIYLLLESMESTYSSPEYGGGFEQNLIPGLTELALKEEYLQFSNTEQIGGALPMPGLGWTVAGMIGQTAGIPLKVQLQDSVYGVGDTFLPGAISIGEILKQEGYHLEYMMGSEAHFGERSQYLIDHGPFYINDYNTAIEDGRLPADYDVFWGYEDEKLFEFAKQRLVELADQDQPFYFGMLTVDTHFPDGYLYDDFPQPFDDSYSNAIYCSDSRICDFIHWFEEQAFYENTTLIVCGDHTSMANGFFKDIPSDCQRTVFNLIVNPAVEVSEDQQHNRLFSTIDMYPTTLGAMGVEIEGDQLAYGVNLFSDTPTLTEQIGPEAFAKMMGGTSIFYKERIILNKKWIPSNAIARDEQIHNYLKYYRDIQERAVTH